MISAERIAEAKAELGLVNPFHEHDDSIYITYQWLDAQRKLKGLAKKWIALKHVIENWGGRYVSQSDVEIAAFLHPEIRGTYPYFNLAHRLTLPSEKRLLGIGFARTQRYVLDPRVYTYFESEEDLVPLMLRQRGQADPAACRGPASELWLRIRGRGYRRRRPWRLQEISGHAG